ncbi:hypothetical protein ACJIZ3_003749 [Penstemon smallii]|uniref:Uncharacterized protein n=1 Tax=Penstemon smallii TaxID=265156 RepID=A0ABD3UC35_9LAMI
MKCRPFGDIRSGHLLSEEELKKAHCYILTNCEEVESYINIILHGLTNISLHIDEFVAPPEV